MAGLRRGRLSVGASTTIGVYLLPQVFVKFRQLYPGVQMNLTIANSATVQSELLSGSIDIGLTETAVDSEVFESSVFLEDELVAIATPKHPLARRRSVTAKFLSREPFIVRETGSGTKSLVERAFAARGLKLRPAMSLGSTEAIKRAVAGGVSIAIVSRLTIALELEAKRLAMIRIADLTIRRPLYYVTLRGVHRSRAVEAFKGLLQTGANGTKQTAPL